MYPLKIAFVLGLMLCGRAYSAEADGTTQVDGTACCVSVSLEVTPKAISDAKPASDVKSALSIKLTNVGKESVRFDIDSGPWGGFGQLRLVAIKLPSGVAVKNELRTMIDSAFGTIELKPKESVEYDVPIAHLYPELAAVIRKKPGGEFVLFWTYQLITDDDRQSERLGGWLALPENWFSRE